MVFILYQVPQYDCRQPFNLRNYQNQPKLNGELDIGDLVLVIFTAGTYTEQSKDAKVSLFNKITLNVILQSNKF